ncbi:MAG: hypothetical protein QOJ39_2056 [Candidatus Eremiobacteraeota bacterium]|jgi:hypothetical protein|nr:hypothetical protein [Candidatus Eremiobacteraeota bacterium]
MPQLDAKRRDTAAPYTVAVKMLETVQRIAFFLLFLTHSTQPHAGWLKIDLVGIGLIFIDIPSGVALLQKGGLERVDYDVRRANGNRIIRIIERPEFDRRVVDFSTKPYCMNGIDGVTTTRNGLRKVLLLLPEAGQNYEYYFEFREADRTAEAIMQTFRINGYHKICESKQS